MLIVLDSFVRNDAGGFFGSRERKHTGYADCFPVCSCLLLELGADDPLPSEGFLDSDGSSYEAHNAMDEMIDLRLIRAREPVRVKLADAQGQFVVL